MTSADLRQTRFLYAIEFSDVTLVRDGKVILKDISWRVKDGEHWAVVGNSGSGKTSVLRIITGYLWPTNGKVEVLGNSFGSVDLRKLRKNIGWISSTLQDQIPPKETALDVVLSGRFASIGLWEKSDTSDVKRASELLDLMGCRECAPYSFGVLSQGEQQRILIARALMSNPDLLILDEPCAGLDLSSREHLLKMVQKLGQKEDGPTMIFVTHHIEEIGSIFSRVLVLKSGSVLAQGNKEKVLSESILSNAFGVPLTVAKINDRFWVQVE